MPASLGATVDTALAAVKNLTDASAVNWASKVAALFDHLAGVSNAFGTAATKDAGGAAGQVPVLDASGRLPVADLPHPIPASSLDGATPADAEGVEKAVLAIGGAVPLGLLPTPPGSFSDVPVLRTFTASGTWHKPTGIFAILVAVVGRASNYVLSGNHESRPGEVKFAMIPAQLLQASVPVGIDAVASLTPSPSHFGGLVYAGLAPAVGDGSGRDGFVLGQIGASVQVSSQPFGIPTPPPIIRTGYGAAPASVTVDRDGAPGVVLVWEF